MKTVLQLPNFKWVQGPGKMWEDGSVGQGL